MASDSSATDHFVSVMADLNRQRFEGEFCDVILEVEGKEFLAHRNVLAACSKYFKTMFTTNMKEKYERNVKIGGISSKTIDQVLDYIYLSRIDLNDDNVLQLLDAFSLMQMQEALNRVVHYMIENLSTTNCLRFRCLGSRYTQNIMVERASTFVLNNFDKIMKQDELYDLKFKDFEQLLQSNNLNVQHEQTVFEVVIKWIDCDNADREKYFPQLFKHVRLQFVPQPYLANTVRKHNLVRKFPDCRDLVEDAFFYLMNPENFASQTPRKHFEKEPNAIMLLTPGVASQMHYDVNDKTWTTTDFVNADENVIKSGCAIAAWKNMVAVCGGLNANNSVSNEVFLFNGECWTAKEPMESPRTDAAAVFVKAVWPRVSPDGKFPVLCVFGGEIVSQTYAQQRNLVHDAEMYVQGNTRRTFVKKPTNSRSCAAAEFVKGRIFVMGGLSQPENDNDQNHSAHTGLSQYGMVPPIWVGEQAHTSLSQFGIVQAAVRRQATSASKTVDVYELETNQWIMGPQMNEERSSFGSASLGSKIYVLGGQTDPNSASFSEFFDTTTEMWTLLKANQGLSLYHLYQVSACCIKGQIYFVGSNTQTQQNSLLRYNPLKNKWIYENQEVIQEGSIVACVL